MSAVSAPGSGRVEAAHCAVPVSEISAFGCRARCLRPFHRLFAKTTTRSTTRDNEVPAPTGLAPMPIATMHSRNALSAGGRSCPLACRRRDHRLIRAWPPRSSRRQLSFATASAAPARARNAHETHAVQCDPGRRAPGRHRRRSEADRPRHRIRRQRTTQEQHLQGRHHPRRALPRSRASSTTAPSATASCRSRKSPAQYFKPASTSGTRRIQDAAPRRPGAHRPGRQGRARQQGRGAHDLHLARRPLPRADAEQPARRRRLAPHRGRGAQRAARRHRPARGARRA